MEAERVVPSKHKVPYKK